MPGQSDLEGALRVAAEAGRWLDLSEVSDKDVPAELLYAILAAPIQAQPPRAVKVRGAHIVGALNFEDSTLRCQLGLEGCVVGDVTLSDAASHAIRLRGCRMASLIADRLETGGDLDLTGSGVTGPVTVAGAHISGQLILDGATLTNKAGPALHGDGLRVDRDMLCGSVLDR